MGVLRVRTMVAACVRGNSELAPCQIEESQTQRVYEHFTSTPGRLDACLAGPEIAHRSAALFYGPTLFE